MDQPEVKAPISDSNIELTGNWQSPFENVGPDQKFSSFSAMLQAGGFAALLEQLRAAMPGNSLAESAANQAAKLEGRSNLTKLNSTQIYSGMPPVKIPVTAHFRAFADPKKEVMDPLNQLIRWHLPKKIGKSLIEERELFASEVPQIIGIKYGDVILAPVVIENLTYPFTGPRSRDGVLTHAAVNMQIATLTALDKQDWEEAYIGNASKTYNF